MLDHKHKTKWVFGSAWKSIAYFWLIISFPLKHIFHILFCFFKYALTFTLSLWVWFLFHWRKKKEEERKKKIRIEFFLILLQRIFLYLCTLLIWNNLSLVQLCKKIRCCRNNYLKRRKSFISYLPLMAIFLFPILANVIKILFST